MLPLDMIKTSFIAHVKKSYNCGGEEKKRKEKKPGGGGTRL